MVNLRQNEAFKIFHLENTNSRQISPAQGTYCPIPWKKFNIETGIIIKNRNLLSRYSVINYVPFLISFVANMYFSVFLIKKAVSLCILVGQR